MTILSDAVAFAQSWFTKELPAEVIEISKRALIDFVGITLAGSNEPASKAAQSYASWLSGCRESKIFGTDIMTSHNLAALANAVAGHALDYDDVSWSTIGHPTVVVAPVVFAAGQVVDASGKDVIKSYALGVEIAHKIAGLAMPQVSENGWHTTSVFGPFGAAAASALLSGLSADSFLSALAIAASTSSGLRANFGTLTKAYHAGMAAYNGATATILARSGLTAAADVIEARDGFVNVFGGQKTKAQTIHFGEPWDIVKPGLVFKRYPCCSGTHPAIDCILEMIKQTPITAEQIQSIEVGVSQLGLRELVCHDPATPTEAKFSMEYAISAAVVYGRVSLEEFKESTVRDPKIKKLLKKINMQLDPEFVPLGFIGTAPAKLQVNLKDGRVLTGRCMLAKGNPEKPLSDSELSSKFYDCVSSIYEPSHARQVLDSLFALENMGDINLLLNSV